MTRAEVFAALEGTHPRLGRLVPFIDNLLIFVTVVAIAVETLPGLPDWAVETLWIVELATVGWFAGEYVLRLWSGPSARRYAFSFWGVVDLMSFLPTLLFLGADLRALRVLRVARLLRLLRLMRYLKALDRFARAFTEIRAELAVFTGLTTMVLYLAAVGIYHFEHEAQPEAFGSIPQSLWWSVATLTTVGYGDVYPITTGGRIFTGVVLLLGLGVVAVPTGLIATALTAKREEELAEERREEADRDREA